MAFATEELSESTRSHDRIFNRSIIAGSIGRYHRRSEPAPPGMCCIGDKWKSQASMAGVNGRPS